MEEATIKLISGLLQTVGFPIVVAGWLLWRTDKRLEEQTKAIRALVSAVKGEIQEDL